MVLWNGHINRWYHYSWNLFFILFFVTLSIMVRKDESNTLIENKFDELKNAFVNETKELFIKEMKDEMKKLFAEEFEKIKTKTNKKMEELKSTSVMLQKHVKNLKRSNEELQKKKKMRIT